MQQAVKHLRVRNKKLFVAAILVSLCVVGIVPAYAASIADLLTSIISILYSTILNVIVGAAEIIINIMLVTLSVDINTLNDWGFLEGFKVFGYAIRALAVGIATIATLWQLFSMLFSPYLGLQQTKSVGSIVARALIFIPLTYVIQPIGYTVFSQMQLVYTALLNGYQSADVGMNGMRLVQISNFINLDTFLEDIAGTMEGDPLAEIISVMSAPILALVSQTLAGVFILIILWNFLKLLFELAQRFVIMLVYIYLSPLAAAAGTVGDGEVPKKSLTVFFSSGILWLLNVWCVGIGVSLMSMGSVGMRHGATGTFIWGVVTYGFLKIAQQLDDIFNVVGASNTTLRSGLIDTVLDVGGLVRNVARFSMQTKQSLGSDKNNPVAASATKMNAASAKAPKLPERVGTALSKTKLGNAVLSAANRATTGFDNTVSKVTGINPGAQQKVMGSLRPPTSATPAPSRTDKVAAAFKTPVGEARQKGLADLYKNDSGIFNDKKVVSAVGQDVLGLPKGATLNSLSYNPTTGQLSGLVTSTDANGKVTTMRVSDINNAAQTTPGAGQRLKNEMEMSSKTYSDLQSGRVQKLDDFNAAKSMSGQALSGNSGQNFATVNYKNSENQSGTLQIERGGVLPENKGVMFNVIGSNGTEAAIAAPANATAEDVGKVLMGKASPDMAKAFEEVQKEHGQTANSTGYVQMAMQSNPAGQNVVFGNSANTKVSLTDKTADGKDTVVSLSPADGAKPNEGRYWNVAVNGEKVGSYKTSYDASPYDAADEFLHGQGAEKVRKAANITLDDQNQSSFEKSPNAGYTFVTHDKETNKDVAYGFNKNISNDANDGHDMWTITKNGKDAGTFEMPSGTSAREAVASFVNDIEFANARMQTGISVQNEASEVLAGTAFENSPNTKATVSLPGKDGENSAYTITRVFTGNTDDAPDVYGVLDQNGNTLGTYEVAKNTGAVSAARMFVHDDSLAYLRNEIGIGNTEGVNPDIFFDIQQELSGPEPMAPEVSPAHVGLRGDGTTWNAWSNVAYERTDGGHEKANVFVPLRNKDDSELFTPTGISVVDYGLNSDKTNRDIGCTFTKDGQQITTHCLTTPDVSVDNVAAALLSGDFQTGNLSGFERLIEQLGIHEDSAQLDYNSAYESTHLAHESWREQNAPKKEFKKAKRPFSKQSEK